MLEEGVDFEAAELGCGPWCVMAEKAPYPVGIGLFGTRAVMACTNGFVNTPEERGARGGGRGSSGKHLDEPCNSLRVPEKLGGRLANYVLWQCRPTGELRRATVTLLVHPPAIQRSSAASRAA